MTTFTFETVDGSGAGQSCLALDKEGNPHIAYATHLQPATLPNVMYAHRNAGTWALERLPTGTIVEQSDENRVCLAIDSQGNPQVAYIDDSSNHLIWAVKRGDSWTFTHVPTRFLIDPQNVDAISFQLELGGSDPAAQDTPHFAFHDAGQQALGHTTIVDGKLQATVVEQIGIGVHAEGFDTGLHPSLAWDPHASPMLAYFNINDTGDLMALRNATLLNGTWQIALLVPGGRKMGASVPVAFGIRAVAYFDVLNSALKVWADGEDRIVAPGNFLMAACFLRRPLMFFNNLALPTKTKASSNLPRATSSANGPSRSSILPVASCRRWLMTISAMPISHTRQATR